MAEARDTRGRRVKWMRRIAWVLALIWAGLWTWFVAGAALYAVEICSTVSPLNLVARPLWQCIGRLWHLFPVVLLLWAPAAIARRREAIAGILLALEGLLGFAWVALLARADWQDMLRLGQPMPGQLLLWPFILVLALAVPPSAAGSLLLASWRQSRRLAAPEATE